MTDWIPSVVLVPLAVAAGYGAGLLHFRSLRRVTDMMVAGRRAAVPLQFARLAGLGMMLLLAALAGAAVLIAAAVGVLAGRARALRQEER